MFIPYAVDDENEYLGRPVLVYVFCGVYVAAHVILYCFMSETAREDVFYRLGCVPAEFRWWSPLTCTFLHGGWLHLAGNLYFFWIYGRSCEKLLGSCKFLLLYVFGAFVSVWAHVLTTPAFYADVPTIGASGAISAVLGAFLIFFPTMKIRFLVVSLVFSRPLPSEGPAYLVIGAWFLMQIAFSLKLTGDNTEVAFWAHVAGFTAGAVMASVYLLLHEKHERRAERETRKLLTESWKPAMAGNAEAAATVGALLVDDKETELPQSWRMFAGVLKTTAGGNSEEAARLFAAEFIKARDSYDYAGMRQTYYSLLVNGETPPLPGWMHRYGALAAARMRSFKLAVHGFHKTALDGGIDNEKPLIEGVGSVLEKMGETEKSAEIKNILMRIDI